MSNISLKANQIFQDLQDLIQDFKKGLSLLAKGEYNLINQETL
jgi:hypothetical protein